MNELIISYSFLNIFIYNFNYNNICFLSYFLTKNDNFNNKK